MNAVLITLQDEKRKQEAILKDFKRSEIKSVHQQEGIKNLESSIKQHQEAINILILNK